jgi:hypothetical protein
MKKIFLYVVLLATGFSTVIVSCKKDGGDATAPGPSITPVIDGYLCTIGIYINNTVDTLVFNVSSGINQARQMVGYGFGSETPENQVALIVQGSSDLFLIKLKIPYINSFGKTQTSSISLLLWCCI